jgi:hypothetical protein
MNMTLVHLGPLWSMSEIKLLSHSSFENTPYVGYSELPLRFRHTSSHLYYSK